MTKQEFTQWIREKLTAILQFEVQNDLAEYIFSMQSEQELDEYCHSLLDMTSPPHKQFLLDLKMRHEFSNQQEKTSVANTHGQNSKDNEKEIDTDKKQKKAESKSKSKKYVNIFSDESLNCQEVFLKGRHKCNCEASRHGLINNCLSCGRIVCKQEGSGPCVVCGELVCSNEEKHILNSKNKESKKLYKLLTEQTINKSVTDKALEHRNTLLEYNRTSAKHTNVINDQIDYYSVNGRMSSNEREQLKKKGEEMQEKKHGLRKTKKITIDFAGSQVYEAKEDSNIDNDIDPTSDNDDSSPTAINEHLNNPLIKINLKFDDNAIQKIKRHSIELNKPLFHFNQRFNRVQDTEIMFMSDQGLCLSMHQPYASLLLLNIKKHEGRTWLTGHRGRLWIASTAKKPSEEDIERVEKFYKDSKGKNIEFPKRYPTGCLMGCLNVVDCLSQEEYITQYPQGENKSPFVFICEDPIMMKKHFPIIDQQKIFKLDKKIHNAAQKCLMKVMF